LHLDHAFFFIVVTAIKVIIDPSTKPGDYPLLMVVKPRSHQVNHRDAKRTGYEDPPLVKAHAVRLKMKLVENWTPLKAIQALIPCKNGNRE